MIRARSVTKQYDTTEALKHIDLVVNEGELFGLIGPDGAGKTSFMRIVMTLLLADGGEVSLAGYDVKRDYKKIRSITGYMPGKFALYPDLTVEENLKFFATVFGTTVKDNYDLIKDIYVQIEPFKKRKAGKLSGGMKQKLALCCALVHKPKVLILDEPTTGVDAVSRKEFWELLYSYKKLGMTILVSTPYMDEAALCDRVGLMQNGRMMMVGTPTEITSSFKGDLWAVSASNIKEKIQSLHAEGDIWSIFSFGQNLHINTRDHSFSDKELLQFLKSKGLHEIEVSRIEAGIEDLFIQLIQQEEEV